MNVWIKTPAGQLLNAAHVEMIEASGKSSQPYRKIFAYMANPEATDVQLYVSPSREVERQASDIECILEWIGKMLVSSTDEIIDLSYVEHLSRMTQRDWDIKQANKRVIPQ